MVLIKNCMQHNQYCILTIDGKKPETGYSKYMIDGREYEPAPLYDMPNCIAIEAAGDFKGKTIIFK